MIRPLLAVLFALSSVMLTVAVQPLSAAQQRVWEIGRFDQSSGEFHAHPDFSDPHDNPIFTVGQSDPAQDWPREQPGSANSEAGARPHPYTIVFNLTNPPEGTCRLAVSVILNRPRVPNLQVEINGKSGLFYSIAR